MRTARLFQNGRSQAVRLPHECRFKGKEIYIKKTPQGVLLTEKDPWELFSEGLAELSNEFLSERDQPEVQPRQF
jgi:antitoxin VapB